MGNYDMSIVAIYIIAATAAVVIGVALWIEEDISRRKKSSSKRKRS